MLAMHSPKYVHSEAAIYLCWSFIQSVLIGERSEPT